VLGWAVNNDWLENSPLMPEHLRRVVILALYTAQRRGDLIALTWAQYDGGGDQGYAREDDNPAAHPCAGRQVDHRSCWWHSAVSPSGSSAA
jgi:integrase